MINKRFNENYENLYTERIKNNLLFLAGWNGKDKFLSNIVLGVHPKLNVKTTTIVMDSISEDPIENYKQLISSEEYKFVVSREELDEHFSNRFDLTIPSNTCIEFSPQDLLMITRNSNGHHIIETIKDIEKYRTDIVNNTVTFLKSINKNIAIEILTKIEDIGFYMRGWKIAFEEIPIHSSNYDRHIYQEEIEKLVYLEIVNFLDNFGAMLSLIPLMILRERNNKITLLPYGKHYSVNSRLNHIIRVDDENSCIRTNSNLLLATSYILMKKTGLTDPKFDITKLRCIS